MSGGVLNDSFHCCAPFADVEQAREQKGPPDMELTRQRAYRLYEQESAKETAARHPQTAS